MKNKIKLIGIIAIIAVIGFTMTACPNEGGGGGGSLGEELELKGQVVMEVFDMQSLMTNGTIKFSIQNFTEDLTINDYGLGGEGSVTNGQLLYKISTPDNLQNSSNAIQWLENEGFEDVEIIGDGVEFATLDYLSTTPGHGIYRTKSNASGNFNMIASTGKMSGTYGDVSYVYVTKDVTIKAKGGTDTAAEDGFSYTYKTNDINLRLKEGWNAVYTKANVSVDISILGGTVSITASMSVSNPSDLRWVYDDGSGDDTPFPFSKLSTRSFLSK